MPPPLWSHGTGTVICYPEAQEVDDSHRVTQLVRQELGPGPAFWGSRKGWIPGQGKEAEGRGAKCEADQGAGHAENNYPCLTPLKELLAPGVLDDQPVPALLGIA